MIGIVDYGMGNLGSVANAVDHLGYSARQVSKAAEIAECERLILPGVGSYRAAMENLTRLELVAPIRAHAAAGKPFLGICLGMQLLSTRGVEHGDTQGLDIIPGVVVPFGASAGLRVPHVGWNNVEMSRSHPVLSGIKTRIDFYFVHSFYFEAADPDTVIAKTPYGDTFVSCVARSSVVGVQFHPEKSQESGLKLIDNFCGWDGTV